MKWLFQQRVRISPLYAHKKNDNFSDTLCDKCDVCKHTENFEHFFLNCIRFTETRRTLKFSIDNKRQFQSIEPPKYNPTVVIWRHFMQ